MRTLLALAFTLATPALAAPAKTPSEIVAAAPAADWRDIPADDLMVMDLASGRRVVIALAPAFAPVHIANIRALVRGGWFDSNAIIRVQDNYVTQWGGADPKRPAPAGVTPTPPAEYERPLEGLKITPLGSPDSYAKTAGFAGGWPVASDGKSAWLPHCYGMVGVGRDMPPDTGTGAELYTVIGHAPRNLDRNIALVGRVIDGMDALSALPRGTAEMGCYADPRENTGITRARLASDMPASERPRYQLLATDTRTFATYLHARANRGDGFYIRAAGAVDICNAPVPTRPAP
ncbi:peptidylprolyl isomerase [Sphingomonas sp. ID0503]|uniref:peptidylprolyl isomerase n=1 Tax=Sphingomonas sp. ID0503 TaxID=3399691 RepID=UPI003AFA23FA